jgi:hypothetical protein
MNNFIEKFDADILNTIIQNEDHFKSIIENNRQSKLDNKYCPFKIASNYLLGSKDGIATVGYHQNGDIGRYFADRCLSLQNLPREIRHSIANKYYIDLDMVNAHPVIFQFLCNKYNFSCPNLSEYINNRDNILNDISNNRDFAKKIILSIINGGDSAYKNMTDKPKFLISFKREMGHLHLLFANKFQVKYNNHCDKRENDGIDYNHLGSFVNKLFCEIENEILMIVWEFYNKSKNVVFCFDGIMLEPTAFNINHIPEIEKLVFDKLGINMLFKQKSMDSGFDFNDIPIIKYDNNPFGIFQSRCNKELTKNEFEILKNDIIEYINSEYCLITGSRSHYVQEMIDLSCDDRIYELVYKDSNSMKIDFADKNLIVKINDNKPIEINIFNIWNKSTSRRRYEGIIFKPWEYNLKDTFEKNSSKKYNFYNLYHGMACDYDSLKDVEPLECSDDIEFFHHIKRRWCKYDDKLFNYILDAFAHMIQKPNKKMGTAIVLKSLARAGKGVIVQLIAEIIGKEYFFHPSKIDDILGDFNSGLANKLLVFVDEMTWGGKRETSAVLKKLITETSLSVNEKFKAKYTIDNYINCIIASNNEWIVPPNMSSTRYQILELDNELALMEDEDAKQKIINDILSIDLKRLAKFFYERDISKFVPTNIIKTEALKDQQIQTLEPHYQWLLNCLVDNTIAGKRMGKNIIQKDLIYDEYVAYCNKLKNIPKSNIAFWKWFVNISDYEKVRRRKYVEFKDIDVLRTKWNKLTNNIYDFTDDIGSDIYEDLEFSL